MTTTDASNPSEQDVFVDKLLNDVPSISQALKNFIAIKLAHQTVASSNRGSRDYRRATAAKQEALAVESEENTGKSASGAVSAATAFGASDAPTLMKFGRAVVGVINSVKLPNVVEWGERYPQTEDQTGMDRMTELSEYKAVHLLWTKVTASPEAKPSKLFGKLFLQCIWSMIREEVLQKSITAILGTKEEKGHRENAESVAKCLLEELEITFRQRVAAAETTETSEPSTKATNVEEEGESVQDLLEALVWVSDYNEALKQRSEARKARAEQKLADHESGIKQLGELMSDHVERNTSSSQIEVVEDGDA